MIKFRKALSLIIFSLLMSLCFSASAAVGGESSATLSGSEEDAAAIYPDALAVSFPEYQDGIVNSKDTGTTEVVRKDTRDAVKIVPNPEGIQGTSTVVDGYHYTGAKIHTGVYKWAAVEYYYESDNPLTSIKMRLSPLPNGGSLLNGVSSDSQDYLSANRWDIAVFDLTAMVKQTNPEAANPHLLQMHIYPFGASNLAKHKGNDAMYISKIMFFKEKPSLVSHPAYISGYSDGTFRPSNFLSRAEGCTIAAKIISDMQSISGTADFDDTDGHWAEEYIGFCSEKGLLDGYSGDFSPDSPITKKEFAALIVSAYSLYSGNKLAVSTDGEIFEDTDSIYSFSGTADSIVSRAEAVAMVNAVRGNVKALQDIDYRYNILFLDVYDNHPGFADIAGATIPHVENNGSWVYSVSNHLDRLCETVGAERLYDLEAGRQKIAELDELEAERIQEIKNTENMDISGISGKKIYVSPNGSDNNSGLSEDDPVKTLTFANSLAKEGDAVLLQRGGMWREKIKGQKGVTYTAYGYGAKPILNGSPEDGADPDLWTLAYKSGETGALIWKYQREDMLDVGEIVFNGGEGYALKELPDCTTDGKYVVYGNRAIDFDYTAELDINFEFFHDITGAYNEDGYINCNSATGALYLRCDNGNPGEVFDSVEFVTRGANITCGGNTDITADNICFMYSNFGISSGTTKNLTVTNCEFYWIGGCIQTYAMRNGIATRYGNAIEIYGGVDGYLVDNCYFYEVYDAAVTHQVGSGDSDLKMDNITYSNNVMDKCQYSIEYFFSGVKTSGAEYTRNGTNVLFDSNLCRRAGYGFGSTRRDLGSQRHIRSGGSRNEFYNFRITNNIFDRSVYELVQTTCSIEETKPVYDGNIYIQGVGNRIFTHGTGESAYTDLLAQKYVAESLGDINAEFYFTEHIPEYTYPEYNPQ